MSWIKKIGNFFTDHQWWLVVIALLGLLLAYQESRPCDSCMAIISNQQEFLENLSDYASEELEHYKKEDIKFKAQLRNIHEIHNFIASAQAVDCPEASSNIQTVNDLIYESRSMIEIGNYIHDQQTWLDECDLNDIGRGTIGLCVSPSGKFVQ